MLMSLVMPSLFLREVSALLLLRVVSSVFSDGGKAAMTADAGLHSDRNSASSTTTARISRF